MVSPRVEPLSDQNGSVQKVFKEKIGETIDNIKKYREEVDKWNDMLPENGKNNK